jgi:GT2 family glycosyltransferase
VDNASTDNTPQLAKGFAAAHPQVTVLTEPELGLSVARNTALTRARGKYVVFLDDDAEAEPGWLDTYRDFFLSPPVSNVACAGGAVFSRHETPPQAWLRPGSDVLDLGDRPRPFQAGAGPWGCNFALHREVSIGLGGFDVSLGRKGKSLAAHEESDLIERIWRAGHEVWWLPAARIQHFVPAERLRLCWQLRSQYNQGRSRAIIQLRTAATRSRKRGFLFRRLLVAPLHLTLNILLALVSLPFRKGQIAAQALLRCARIAGFSRLLLAEMVHSPVAK